MVLVLPPTCLAAWNVAHRTPTVSTLEVSLSRLSGQAECMVHALFLPFWPLVRLAMWLLFSFMATVFYKEAMVWLSGRFLRVAAWRQFFNLTATIFGGEKWSLVACVLPCIVSAVWDLIGPF